MIDFERYWTLSVNFLANNPLITGVIVLVIIIFCYKKPVEAVKFFGFCALIITALYIMSLLSQSGSSGMSNKNVLQSKSKEALEYR